METLGFSILIYYLISNLLFKVNLNTLNCGLFGYVGKKRVELDKLKILGLFNDQRGGHGAGLLLDGIVYKTPVKDDYFYNLIANNTLPEPEIDNVAMGHTRKGSVGGRSENNQHPFEVYADDKDTEPVLIGAHNGTIRNWTSLCTKYGVNHANIWVDSLGIMSILAKGEKNLSVFNEYEGDGCFTFYRPKEKNTLYIFKGASIKTANGELEEERPLFYWQKSKEELYYSSIEGALYAIGGDLDTVHSFECNVIIKIHDGRISKLKFPINRDAVNKPKVYNYPTNNYQAKRYYAPLGRMCSEDEIDDYELLEHFYPGGEFRGSHTLPKEATETFQKVGETSLSKISIIEGYGSIGKLIYERKNISKGYLNTEVINLDTNAYGHRVYFNKGKYYRNGHLVGQNDVVFLSLDKNGYNEDSIHKTGDVTLKVFYKGYMFKTLQHYYDYQDNDDADLNMTIIAYRTQPKSHLKFSYYITPFCHDQFNNTFDSIAIDGAYSSKTIIIHPQFSNRIYDLFNGEVNKVRCGKSFPTIREIQAIQKGSLVPFVADKNVTSTRDENGLETKVINIREANDEGEDYTPPTLKKFTQNQIVKLIFKREEYRKYFATAYDEDLDTIDYNNKKNYDSLVDKEQNALDECDNMMNSLLDQIENYIDTYSLKELKNKATEKHGNTLFQLEKFIKSKHKIEVTDGND